MVTRATLDIIGAGNWGSSLAAAVAGARVVRRSAWPRYPPSAALIWLCVSDKDIASVASDLAARIRKGATRPKAVVHSSGALSSVVLAPLHALGVPVASAHPWMTFPTRRAVPLRGVYFALEGDLAARRAVAAIIRGFGGRTFTLQAKEKILYHTFATLCSPLLVAHLAAAEHVAVKAGLPAEIARKLAGILSGASLQNYVRNGADKSFSGPISRGDAETLARHAASLRGAPESAVYGELTRYAIQHLPAKRRAALRDAMKGTPPA